jgi:hypothetical protein
MVLGPLDWILRVASCTSVGVPFDLLKSGHTTTHKIIMENKNQTN